MTMAMEPRVLRCLRRTGLCLGVAAAPVVAAVLLFGPRIISCSLNANESAAIATLKNIHSGQQQFRAAAAVDCDNDGNGEFGWLPELAGVAPLRGHPAAALLASPCLSQAFGRLVGGRAVRSGYLFQLWLPRRGGGWLADGVPGEVDHEAAATDFRCAAWPLDKDAARRAFFVAADGDVWSCGNDDRRYLGHTRPLPAGVLVAPTAGSLASLVPIRSSDWVCVQ